MIYRDARESALSEEEIIKLAKAGPRIAQLIEENKELREIIKINKDRLDEFLSSQEKFNSNKEKFIKELVELALQYEIFGRGPIA